MFFSDVCGKSVAKNMIFSGVCGKITTKEVATREAEVAVREAEQSRKYDTLLLQLQNMMKMFQQSQNPPS
ncbi:hypothetical protein J1N35_000564 [Gossypium stocksii]|uniref:Uncharacterized protein n=1 Tax=Gossypium stocksii TaxID=47602 RepID=A0A9D3WIL3_9ROSI|nr:hypothetical protein J1N35_000564 [Gossypium stocksii]